MIRALALCFLPASLLLAQTALGADDDKSKDPADAKKAAAKEEFQRVEERQPRAGTPLIADKLYPMQGRFELTGIFDYSFNDKYVEHTGGSGSIGFHIFDWLAVEGFGGYLVGQETGIVANVRQDGTSAKLFNTHGQCANKTCEPQLPDMWMTTWFAGADVQWAPIYGKISAVSEYDLNFQLYALLGGGAEGIQRKLNDGTFQDGSAVGLPFGLPFRLSANYGLGVRLIPWKWVALRAEIRNYNGLNPNVEEHRSQDEQACTGGYTLVVGADRQCYPDIYNSTMLQVGLSLLL